MLFITPFLIGLFSGFHCVMMCGALCNVICQNKNTKTVLITNLGRVLTYTILGLLFAGIIQGASLSINLADIGFWLRTIMGTSMVFIGFSIFLQMKNRLLQLNKGLPVWPSASRALSHLKSKVSPHHFFIKGMLWGLIPCGLLYSLLLIAATTADILRGGLFMFFFGLGTLTPLVISQQLFQKMQKSNHIKWFQKISGGFIIFMGLWITISPWTAHYLIPLNNNLFTEISAVLDLCIP